MDSTCLEGNKYVVYVVPKCVLSTSSSASYKPHLKQGRDSLSSCLLWADLDCSKSGCKSSLLVTVFMTERWSPGRLNRTKRWYIPHMWPQKPNSHQYCIKDKSVKPRWRRERKKKKVFFILYIYSLWCQLVYRIFATYHTIGFTDYIEWLTMVG